MLLSPFFITFFFGNSPKSCSNLGKLHSLRFFSNWGKKKSAGLALHTLRQRSIFCPKIDLVEKTIFLAHLCAKICIIVTKHHLLGWRNFYRLGWAQNLHFGQKLDFWHSVQQSTGQPRIRKRTSFLAPICQNFRLHMVSNFSTADLSCLVKSL